ncbi:MAG: DUF362 domain-containing protein [Candidatus Omnitrophica bacterium]|nr:DUF362 domain-containing protein [Candidatus Omnitrophota bacterium]
MKSNVYFIRVDSQDNSQRIKSLQKFLDKLGHVLTYQKEEFVPVKITIGDTSCVYNIKPEFVRCIITHIKNQQARPFLFDTNVIYLGQRQNAIQHLNLAQNKGFAHSRVGAPFIIADGIFGQDGREFKINSANVNKIKVPSFVGMLDSLLVLSHATGHILSGYAGAIKNVAMGMSCRPTKQTIHSLLKPHILTDRCTTCRCCIAICPKGAISYKDSKVSIDPTKCIGCAECLCACKFNAISINWQEEPLVFIRRLVEVANFILSKFKNKFFINFAFDITKECDCISTKDEKMIVDDLGIFASDDIVAVDKATVDMAKNYKRMPLLDQTEKIYTEMFLYAQRIGMGSAEYSLIQL